MCTTDILRTMRDNLMKNEMAIEETHRLKLLEREFIMEQVTVITNEDGPDVHPINMQQEQSVLTHICCE